MPADLAAMVERAWFWVIIAADFLFIASTLFSVLYMLFLLARSLSPHRVNPTLYPVCFAAMSLLSLVLACTPAAKAVAGLWRGVAWTLLGDMAELFLPAVPVYVWLAGAAVSLLLLFCRRAALSRRIPLLPSAADSAFDAARAVADLATPVQLKTLETGATPCSWGGRAPSVLTSDDFRIVFTHDERRCIYLHELVHIRNRDPARYLLAQVAMAVFWFQPFVRHALHSLFSSIEATCDAQTLRLSGIAPMAYARLILKAQSLATALRPGFAAAEKADLYARLGQITNDPVFFRRTKRGLFLPLCCLATLAVLGMAFRDYIVAEWRLRPPPPVQPMTGHIPQHEIAVTFFWSGALGTYIHATPVKKQSSPIQ